MFLINVKNKWKVIISYNPNERNRLYSLLVSSYCPNPYHASNMLNKVNSGFTYTYEPLRLSIVGISPATSEPEWFNTLVHELKHVLSRICSYYNIDEDSEEASYLIGFLMKSVMLMIN